MSEGKMLQPPEVYEYPQRVSVVCPKCGHLSAFPFVATDGTRAGVRTESAAIVVEEIYAEVRRACADRQKLQLKQSLGAARQ